MKEKRVLLKRRAPQEQSDFDKGVSVPTQTYKNAFRVSRVSPLGQCLLTTWQEAKPKGKIATLASKGFRALKKPFHSSKKQPAITSHRVSCRSFENPELQS